MVYQIEENNVKNTSKPQPAQPIRKSSLSTKQDIPVKVNEEKQSLMMMLDDMYAKISVESALVETDFKQKFDTGSTDKPKATAYQTLKSINDSVSVLGEKFTFLNGKLQSSYEKALLEKLELPGINNRFKMPLKETRKIAERESDTGLIVSKCFSDNHERADGQMSVNRAKRLTLLKYFEKLL